MLPALLPQLKRLEMLLASRALAIMLEHSLKLGGFPILDGLVRAGEECSAKVLEGTLELRVILEELSFLGLHSRSLGALLLFPSCGDKTRHVSSPFRPAVGTTRSKNTIRLFFLLVKLESF